MKVFAYDLKPMSGFREPLRSSTLWGHLAWAVRELKGEASLLGWIEEHRRAIEEGRHPPVRLSSAFPKDTLPRPMLPPVLVEDTVLRKRAKAVRWLPLDAFAQVAARGEAALLELIENDRLPATATQGRSSRTRVAMDRRTGAAAAGRLFEEALYWYSETLTIYAKTSAPNEATQLAELLEFVGWMGYGGGSSTGNGWFKLMDGPREVMLPSQPDGAYALLLGPGLPPQSGDGWWRTETYWGRMGRGFATAAVPFKRPYLRLVEGSVVRKPRPRLLEVTPPVAPTEGVSVWENLDPLMLPLEVRRE